jgi:hypothetical protein
MANEVDIVNTALGHLGDSATVASISPPDGSAQAGRAAVFYPIARDQMLQRFPWSFATRRATLQAISNSEQPTSWLYSYAKPSGCLQIHNVFPEAHINDGQARYVEYECEILSSGTQVIYSNLANASIKYTAAVTDTTAFPPLFTAALARLLASMLAGPLLRGKTGASVAIDQLKLYTQIDLPAAMRADAMTRKSSLRSTFVPSAIQARL